MVSWIRPIQTQQSRVSFFAIVAINLLWFCNMFQVFVTTNALAFTVRRFTDDTRLVTLATSIGYGFSFLIGPACNYLSDRIWTRIGRRRPFLLIGWSAVAVAMLLIPIMPSYGALVTLIIAYTLLGDMATPLEPLCMEVVPPQQRSRSMSVRLVLVQAALLIYFQLLFPRFDQLLVFPDWVPLLGGVGITGERLIYSITAGLMFSMVLFLIICVREVKVDAAPNIRPRDLKFAPITAIWTFLKDTFGDRRWLWVYALYCAGNAFFYAWTQSPIYSLMLTEQFGFAKGDIGRMMLPAQLIGVTLLLPVMGWFGDRFPKIPYMVLVSIPTAALLAIVYLVRFEEGISLNQLPPLHWLLILGGLMIATVGSVYLMVARFIVGKTGTQGGRVYVFLGSLCLEVLQCIGCFGLIHYYQHTIGAAPPLLIWFLFDLIRMTLKSSTEVVTGPMYFDFVPRDRMGTLSSGFGFTNSLLIFTLTNTVGIWIQTFSGDGPKNYASAYLFQSMVGLLAIYGVAMFLKNFRAGRIVEYGRLGFDAGSKPPEKAA